MRQILKFAYVAAGIALSVAAHGFNSDKAQAASLVHRWSFNDGTGTDSVGGANLSLNSGATIQNGQLSLDGIDDYAQSSKIQETLTAKTLMVWGTLANLEQRSGSLLTIENPGIWWPRWDTQFDGIVYGERTANQWMAGSDYFKRTPEENNGALENSLKETMLAISYDNSGSINIYRDGQKYASYNAGSTQSFSADLAQVLLGLRASVLVDVGEEGTATGNDGFLAGLINEARIYDGALTDSQIAGAYKVGPQAVPEPSTMLGLAVAGAFYKVAGRRRKKSQP